MARFKVKGLTPRKLRSIRRHKIVGDAAAFGLDEVHGVVRVRIYDAGDAETGVVMMDSTAVVFVWTTGDPKRVIELAEPRLPRNSWVCLVVFEARWRDIWRERIRWLWWRLVARRNWAKMLAEAKRAKAAMVKTPKNRHKAKEPVG